MLCVVCLNGNMCVCMCACARNTTSNMHKVYIKHTSPGGKLHAPLIWMTPKFRRSLPLLRCFSGQSIRNIYIIPVAYVLFPPKYIYNSVYELICYNSQMNIGVSAEQSRQACGIFHLNNANNTKREEKHQRFMLSQQYSLCWIFF